MVDTRRSTLAASVETGLSAYEVACQEAAVRGLRYAIADVCVALSGRARARICPAGRTMRSRRQLPRPLRPLLF
jgi:hypothetical protein